MTVAKREAVVCNERGLHARAAARFAAAAEPFDARVTVAKDGQCVDGASLMDLLMLGAGRGTQLVIRAEGPQAAEAAGVLAALIDGGFGEGV